VASLLANLLSKAGNSEEADELCIRAIDGLIKCVGPKHADTLRALNNHAIILQRLDKVCSQLGLLIKKLEMRAQ
jgi:hypothetical protein